MLMPRDETKWVHKTCPTCGKEFDAPLWRVRRVKTIYCSARCAKHKVDVLCDWCGCSFQKTPSALGKHNFCSRKCCRAWQGAEGIVGVPYARIQLVCQICGDSFEREQNAVGKNNYCSKECFYKAHRARMVGEKNPSWRGGGEFYYGPNWKRQARRARVRDGHVCQHCGVAEAALDKKLHVHHITPLRSFERDFRSANSLRNLVSLCPSCHKYLEWHEDHMNQFLASWQPTISFSLSRF